MMSEYDWTDELTIIKTQLEMLNDTWKPRTAPSLAQDPVGDLVIYRRHKDDDAEAAVWWWRQQLQTAGTHKTLHDMGKAARRQRIHDSKRR